LSLSSKNASPFSRGTEFKVSLSCFPKNSIPRKKEKVWSLKRIIHKMLK